MKTKRTCTRCHLPIAKTHRWHTVYHRFLFWTWATIEHRDCNFPMLNGKRGRVRLKGEVPLPFPPEPLLDSVLGQGASETILGAYTEHGQNLPL